MLIQLLELALTDHGKGRKEKARDKVREKNLEKKLEKKKRKQREDTEKSKRKRSKRKSKKSWEEDDMYSDPDQDNEDERDNDDYDEKYSRGRSHPNPRGDRDAHDESSRVVVGEVAEVTERRFRLRSMQRIFKAQHSEPRPPPSHLSPLEQVEWLNEGEKQAFWSGKKRVAVLSGAVCTDFYPPSSLSASFAPLTHVVLQLPWNAQQALSQLSASLPPSAPFPSVPEASQSPYCPYHMFTLDVAHDQALFAEAALLMTMRGAVLTTPSSSLPCPLDSSVSHRSLKTLISTLKDVVRPLGTAGTILTLGGDLSPSFHLSSVGLIAPRPGDFKTEVSSNVTPRLFFERILGLTLPAQQYFLTVFCKILQQEVDEIQQKRVKRVLLEAIFQKTGAKLPVSNRFPFASSSYAYSGSVAAVSSISSSSSSSWSKIHERLLAHPRPRKQRIHSHSSVLGQQQAQPHQQQSPRSRQHRLLSLLADASKLHLRPTPKRTSPEPTWDQGVVKAEGNESKDTEEEDANSSEDGGRLAKRLRRGQRRRDQANSSHQGLALLASINFDRVNEGLDFVEDEVQKEGEADEEERVHETRNAKNKRSRSIKQSEDGASSRRRMPKKQDEEQKGQMKEHHLREEFEATVSEQEAADDDDAAEPLDIDNELHPVNAPLDLVSDDELSEPKAEDEDEEAEESDDEFEEKQERGKRKYVGLERSARKVLYRMMRGASSRETKKVAQEDMQLALKRQRLAIRSIKASKKEQSSNSAKQQSATKESKEVEDSETIKKKKKKNKKEESKKSPIRNRTNAKAKSRRSPPNLRLASLRTRSSQQDADRDDEAEAAAKEPQDAADEASAADSMTEDEEVGDNQDENEAGEKVKNEAEQIKPETKEEEEEEEGEAVEADEAVQQSSGSTAASIVSGRSIRSSRLLKRATPARMAPVRQPHGQDLEAETAEAEEGAQLQPSQPSRPNSDDQSAQLNARRPSLRSTRSSSADAAQAHHDGERMNMRKHDGSSQENVRKTRSSKNSKEEEVMSHKPKSENGMGSRRSNESTSSSNESKSGHRKQGDGSAGESEQEPEPNGEGCPSPSQARETRTRRPSIAQLSNNVLESPVQDAGKKKKKKKKRMSEAEKLQAEIRGRGSLSSAKRVTRSGRVSSNEPSEEAEKEEDGGKGGSKEGDEEIEGSKEGEEEIEEAVAASAPRPSRSSAVPDSPVSRSTRRRSSRRNV